MIQRIATSLLEESAPAESEIRNEALLSKILRRSRYIDDRIDFYNATGQNESQDMATNSSLTSTHHVDSSFNVSDMLSTEKLPFTCRKNLDIDTVFIDTFVYPLTFFR